MSRLRTLAAIAAFWMSPVPGWAASITGTYCGAVLSSGEMTDVVTRLKQEADGRITGSYKFMDGETPVTGSLIARGAPGAVQYDFLWRDKFGSGKVVITPAADGNSFTGKWGTGANPPEHDWLGKRCADQAEPGIAS